MLPDLHQNSTLFYVILWVFFCINFVEKIKKMVDASLQMGSSFILAGPSSCGKSSFIRNLIKCRNNIFNKNIRNVYIVCSNVQGIYEELVKSKDVKKIFYEMPTEDEIREIAEIEKERGGTILILDDILPEIEKSKKLIEKMFTEIAHHWDMSIFLCVQNLFYRSDLFRTLSLNAAYLIPFKHPRDTVTFMIILFNL